MRCRYRRRSRLSAIEELAGVDVLCSDKTGTLTMNQLTVEKQIPFGTFTADDVLRDAALATQKSSADAIDVAVLAAAGSRVDFAKVRQTDFVPFDPVNKRTVATILEDAGKTRHYAKGAPQAITALAKPDAELLSRYQGTVAELASKGYRALGVGQSEDGKTWSIVGLISLMDPPRPDAKATIDAAKALGVNVKMVTGDDVAIGDQIAAQLDLGDHLLVAGDVFKDEAKSGAVSAAVMDAVERAVGFGRVFPEHKYEIVKVLQARGHIVGMTGDGVNDAPALKQADCGIAVSGATDAARSAAALILTAPGLSTIVNAIGVARQIFERIESYVHYRVAMTLDIMVLVVASIVLFQFQPLTAIMIVALALLDDIPIMTIAYDNVPAPPEPVRWKMHSILLFASIMGLLSLVETFGVLLIGLRWIADPQLLDMIKLDHAQLQTVMFPAARGWRPSASVHRPHQTLTVRAAISEPPAVLGHCGDADRGRRHLRAGCRRARDPASGDCCGLGLLPDLDGGARPSETCVSSHRRRARPRLGAPERESFRVSEISGKYHNEFDEAAEGSTGVAGQTGEHRSVLPRQMEGRR
jgi:H+-transporting ATPase